MKWLNFFFKLAVIVIAIVLFAAGIFLWKHYDPEEARLQKDAASGNRAAQRLLGTRNEYRTARYNDQMSQLCTDTVVLNLVSGEVRQRTRPFEEGMLKEDCYLYKDDGSRVREIKAGQPVRVFWDFQRDPNSSSVTPSIFSDFSENLILVSILNRDGGEEWGYVRETKIGKRPSMDGSWWDLPLEGNQIFHRGVKLMPGQKSRELSFVIKEDIKYNFWTSDRSVVLYAWVNGKEVVFLPNGHQECPHICGFGVVQVQLSSLESEPQTIRFGVERL